MGISPTDEEPDGPGEILRRLPARERLEFLRQYRAALKFDAADTGDRPAMNRLLRRWRLVVVAANQAGYYEAISDAKAGIGTTTPFGVALAAELARRT